MNDERTLFVFDKHKKTKSKANVWIYKIYTDLIERMIWLAKFGLNWKLLSSSRSTRLLHYTPKEISIKVPWGHIAGLLWNDSTTSASPFLCLHGWKDNAASFNKLIPALLDHSTDHQFLAIDLPGHGLSSHYPPGMVYQLVDHLIAIQRVVTHFGWGESEGIHLMGHSLGAIIAFLFAATHPKTVDCMIAIDALVPLFFTHADLINMLRITTEGFLKMESLTTKSGPLIRTFDEIRKTIRESHMGINETACDVLMTRGVKEIPPGSGKWAFTHDPRVHYLPLMNVSPDQIEHFAHAFQSKLLVIKADNGVNYLSDYVEADMKKWLTKDNPQHVRFVTAKDAGHHVHMAEPEKIVPDIVKFLKETHQ